MTKLPTNMADRSETLTVDLTLQPALMQRGKTTTLTTEDGSGRIECALVEQRTTLTETQYVIAVRITAPRKPTAKILVP